MPKNIFDFPVNKELLALYIRVFRQNQRQGTSSTKTQSEVSGTGKKPFKQKGTGNARQGSRRSPQFVHGGISHGPQPKDWTLDFPKAFKKQALRSALALKSTKDLITILEKLDLKSPKTKDLITQIGVVNKTLLVISAENKNILQSGRNIAGLNIVSANQLNAYEVLNANSVLFSTESLKEVKERL